MMVRMRWIVAVFSVAGLLSACGDDGPEGARTLEPAGTPESPRTVEITMIDIAFEPTAVTIQAGETIRFLFTNDGAIEHEATFGDADEQEEHAEEMREAEGMDMHGTDEPSGDHADGDGDDGHGDAAAPLVLEPGETGEVTMIFDDPDMSSTIIGCHVPGHWEAGMRVDVAVATA